MAKRGETFSLLVSAKGGRATKGKRKNYVKKVREEGPLVHGAASHFRVRAIRCGKKNCSACPHVFYKYQVWREGGKVRERYVGKCTSSGWTHSSWTKREPVDDRRAEELRAKGLPVCRIPTLAEAAAFAREFPEHVQPMPKASSASSGRAGSTRRSPAARRTSKAKKRDAGRAKPW